MKKLLQLLILLFTLQSCESNAQKNIPQNKEKTQMLHNDIILNGKYSFIMRSGKNDEIKVSGDSLIFESSIMKITQVKRAGSSVVLVLEKIKTNEYVPEELSESMKNNRFWIMMIKTIDSNSFGLSWREGLLPKEEIAEIISQKYDDEKIFFRTFYSQEYLKQFSKLKNIETEEDAQKIIAVYESEEFKNWYDLYIYDTQNGGSFNGDTFRSEALNRICIKLGYNPIGAFEKFKKFVE